MGLIDLVLMVGVVFSGGKVMHCAKSYYVLAYEKYKWRFAGQILFLITALTIFAAIHIEGCFYGKDTRKKVFNYTAAFHLLLEQSLGLVFLYFDHPFDIFNEFNKYPEMVPRISIFQLSKAEKLEQQTG